MTETESTTTPTDPHAAGDAPHVHYDPLGIKMGMWLFLFTEVLLFGMMFIAYAVFLHRYKFDFQHASQELDVMMGAVNTIILLTSSLTAVLSITALNKGNKKLSAGMLVVTIVCAAAFLVIKWFEWSAKIHHDIYPNSPIFADMPRGEVVYFGLYYLMTGAHAVHVLIGIGVIAWALKKVLDGTSTPEKPAFLDNVALYWHLVDVVWIYLFPLFYLIQ